MDEILQVIKTGDVKKIVEFMDRHGLTLKDGKIIPTPEKKQYVIEQISFWNQRQQARKILLNSLYGALLNEALRFFDPRMGQSVTLTGRSIVRHMNAQVNQIITSIYDYMGESIMYSDTDSSYFSPLALKLEKFADWRTKLFEALHAREQIILEEEIEAGVDEAKRTKIIYDNFDFDNFDHIIRISDDIAFMANATFPDFMHNTFNTTHERGAIIAAGRELVASKMLFIKKKKYGGMIYDLEGERMDTGNKPGKLKAMGLDLKRADTPKFMQEFLEKLLVDILTGADSKNIIGQIKEFRISFKGRPAWEKGSPKKVSNLSKYRAMMERSASMGLTDRRRKGEKAKNTIPGHVRASVNWNNLLDAHNDKFSMRITDGSRIIVCKLLPNLMKLDSVAYPMDEPHLPQWFKDLPFDHAAMEEVIISKKVDNLVGVLKWPLEDSMVLSGEEFFSFD